MRGGSSVNPTFLPDVATIFRRYPRPVLDLLSALAVVTVLVAVALTALAGVTVVPWTLAQVMAERRRFAPVRCGAVATGGILVGLLGAFAWLRSDLPTAVAVVPLALTWAGPGLLWLTSGDEAFGGRPGRHG